MRPLGGGSRCEAYLVRDEALGSAAVAKLVRPDRVSEGRALRALRREAGIVERLSHPAIVRGLGAAIDGPHPHLLLEYVEGPSLRELLRGGTTLGASRLVPLAVAVASALDHMASRGVVHLDVKPSNIIIGPSPRLIDLSVARTLERARRLRGVVGTDAYIAPEQCDPQARPGQIGPPADVWGLAATIHHAVAGAKPFPREKSARRHPDPEVRFPQLHSPPCPLPATIPAAFAELLAAAMLRDPAARPTAAEFAARLAALTSAAG